MDQHIEREFDTPDPVELHVVLGGGTLQAEATDTDKSTVEVTGPRAAEFTVEMRGKELAVIAPRGGGLFRSDQHTVRVVVPTQSDLSTQIGSADTEATGTWGAVRAKTGSGSFDLESADRHVIVDSGSGNVSVDRVAADLRIKSGSADVEVGEVHGTAAVSTGSGDIAIGSALGSTVLKTGSGDIEAQRTSNDLNLITGSGTIGIGHAQNGNIRARAGSGDLRVGIPVGVAVWTDITTSSGRVVSDLPPTGKPAEGQDHVELRLRTGSGDVILGQVPAQS